MTKGGGLIKRTTSGEGLRELRSMPEGSYLISTDFDASSLELNVIRILYAVRFQCASAPTLSILLI